MQPLVSVIVPIYNVEIFLERCIDSIIKQTYERLEIILVDDGSPDECPSICDDYAKRDKRIFVIHKENGGLSSARNAGLDHAHGDYIVFVDSDDFLEESAIFESVDIMKKDDSDITIFNFNYCDENGNIISFERMSPAKQKWNEEDFWNYYFTSSSVLCVVAWNKIFKKQLFSDVRFPLGVFHEDEFVIHYLISKCKTISFVDKSLYWYRQRNGSIMNNHQTKNDIDAINALLTRCSYFLEKGNAFFSRKTFRLLFQKYHFLKKYQKKSETISPEDFCLLSKKVKRSYKEVIKNQTNFSSKFYVFVCYKLPFLFELAAKLKTNKATK